nr:hypothetical protein [Tanacetum cinerariifolium]
MKDKYMMKAQYMYQSILQSLMYKLFLKGNTIDKMLKYMLRGRLLACFQDLEHEGGDTRSQGDIKDNDIKIKIQDHKHENEHSKGIPKITRLQVSRRHKKDSQLNDHPLGGNCPRFKVSQSSSAPTARPTRGFRVDYGFVGTLNDEIRRDPERERMTDIVTTVRQDTDKIYRSLDDAHDDRLLISGQLNMLRRDRRAHARTARLMESEARLFRKAWVQSMGACDTTRVEVMSLRTTVLTQQSEIAGLWAADLRRQTQNVRLVELCTLRTIVVLMGVSGTRSFVILIKHPTCLNDPLRIVLNSFEPSNDNTNVVNALQEPFVVKQDPDENSSQSPPQINHHCCYGCGDPLEEIFCHKCTCELCWRGAHYGYNCPPKVPVVPDPEPFNNQTVNELPQTLPSFDPTCYSKDGNSFTYDSASNLVHDSPTYFVVPQPPQEEMRVEFLREKRNQKEYVKTFLRKFNRISFYEMPKVLSLVWETILEIKLAFEDKHCQQENILELFQSLHNDVQNVHEELTVYINTPNWDRPTICYNDDDDEDYAIAVIPSLSTKEPDNSLSMGDEHLYTVPETESDEFIKSSVENLVPIPSESEGIPDNMCDVPFHDNSLPLDVLKDQFEDFSDSNNESISNDDDYFFIDNIEYEIDDDILLTIKDDILRKKLLNVNLLIANIEALKDNPAPSSDFMTKSSSTSLKSLLEETYTFDISLPKCKTFYFDLEEIGSGGTTTRSDISLLKYEAFCDDHVKEISSGSTTTHFDSSLYYSFIFDLLINPFPPADRSDFYEFADELAHIISPPEYDCFCFKNEPNSGDFSTDVVENIFPIREPRVHNALPTIPPFN